MNWAKIGPLINLDTCSFRLGTWRKKASTLQRNSPSVLGGVKNLPVASPFLVFVMFSIVSSSVGSDPRTLRTTSDARTRNKIGLRSCTKISGDSHSAGVKNSSGSRTLLRERPLPRPPPPSAMPAPTDHAPRRPRVCTITSGTSDSAARRSAGNLRRSRPAPHPLVRSATFRPRRINTKFGGSMDIGNVWGVLP